MNNGIIKKILINISLIILNILVFSGSFIGVNPLSGHITDILAGTVVILLTVFVFIWINCAGWLDKLIAMGGSKKSNQEVTSLKQCKAALSVYLDRADAGQFRDGIEGIAARLSKFESKRDAVKKALSESFDSTEITYTKFNATVDTVEAVLIGNAGVLIGRLKVYGGGAPHSEFADFINNVIINCDDILLKMDRLLYELSVLSTQNKEDLANNSAIEELQKLIDSVKWYK